MSIATRTGDDGTTGLMFNRRVPKHHPRVEACGAVDELNAAIGLARALAPAQNSATAEQLLPIQKDLISLMGELATLPEDLGRYERDGFPRITADQTARLDALVADYESKSISFHGWATPGANPASAALDVARTTCRRAERRVTALVETGELGNPHIVKFLNRLSDTLWLMARSLE